MAYDKGNTLRLNCPELHTEIPNIRNESVCADLANLFEHANALTFDDTNKKCSIQLCTGKDNILAKAVTTSNVTIMFESAFYPRCKSFL